MVRKVRVIKWSGKVEDLSICNGNEVFVKAAVLDNKSIILCSV